MSDGVRASERIAARENLATRDKIAARERVAANERCAYCHEEFVAPTDAAGLDERVACSGCGTPLHAECFADNEGCSSLGCARAEARLADGRVVEPSDIDWRRRVRGWPSRWVLLGVAIGTALTIYAVETERFPLLGPLLLVLTFGLALAPLETDRSEEEQRELVLAAPFAPARPPLDAVDAARRLNATASRAASAPLREPTGPSMKCPSCSRLLEGTHGLRYCYHCGVPLE